MTLEEKADRIRKIKNKYHLSDNMIIQDRDLTIIRKIGIIKIQKREKIRYEITHQETKELGTKIGTEDGVYLTGIGRKYNPEGYVSREITVTASATPFNCTFNYKLEVAEARLRARLVLELAGLEEFMGEDELNLDVDKGAHPATMHEDDALIQNALKKIDIGGNR